ncbi:Hypothetical protein FKW44_005521, partial [Caligus rogercresseyi]
VFLSLEISVEGNPPPSLYATPVVEKSASEAHKDPVTAKFALSECIHPLVTMHIMGSIHEIRDGYWRVVVNILSGL